ncbi:MAG: leucine--tRNA ligase [Puniceicoccales bacterium]|jgi:leucyl-tRNA synthetase|nr:leucine--tRNA ligase [Puniceicoccales bacterium]
MEDDRSFSAVEAKWQEFWRREGTFAAENGGDCPPYYVLDMFPYPSGTGLHIGHPEGYTASDILARYHWALGHNVLHPMGWDAFGLPAEQHAVQTGTHPALNTAQNIEKFRGQIRRLGFAIDWSREINTTDPHYYRWTQWIFLQLFRHGLAYVDERPVWWCPQLKTVLANEEIVDGRSERGNFPVERRPMRQWILRITAYAEQLLQGLEGLDWPDSTKRQQIAWIGRSEGAEIDFPLAGLEDPIRIYTTRADTLFGVTYLVLAPEHPALERIVAPGQLAAVEDYRRQAARKGDLERTDLAKEKSGVPTGAQARHPLTGEPIPIWVADYVLGAYGTGAVMAVPAHDGRDFFFAQRHGLPVLPVVWPKDGDGDGGLPYCGPGVLFASEEFSGLSSEEGRAAIVRRLEELGLGRAAVNHRLRDWVFSRQRYWGEPVPIVWVDGADFSAIAANPASPFAEFLPEKPVRALREGREIFAVPLPAGQLPLLLPAVESYLPSDDGESPLARAQDWVGVDLNPESGELRPAGGEGPPAGWIRGRRETNTMPQWAGSCWYHLRYLSPHCSERLVDPAAEAYWRVPNFYIGGAEHAVLHLLYARFWHRFLHTIGAVGTAEPYPRLFHQGLILGEDGNKMSKSRGNVVNPDEVIGRYGADALRLFEMFLGPLDAVKPWDTRAIGGIDRFLKKIWRWCLDEGGQFSQKFSADPCDGSRTQRLLHETIATVRRDIEALHFNTAISQLMILLNHLQRLERVERATALAFLQLLAPFAPHICEELWQRAGESPSIARAPFPVPDPVKLHCETAKILLQINGRLRGDLTVPVDLPAGEVLRLARLHPRVEPHLMEREIVKEVYVSGKVVNFVLR